MVFESDFCCSNCSEHLSNSDDVSVVLNDIQYVSNICSNCGYESFRRLPESEIKSVALNSKKSSSLELACGVLHESNVACDHSVSKQLNSSNKEISVDNHFKVVKKLKDLILDKLD